MKKIVLLAAFFLSLHLIVSAQNTVAKLKYEEAEEAYNNNDFAAAVKKLNEAEKMFGKINPPILHLRILSLNKLYTLQDNTDFEDIADLRAQCLVYLKNYDNLEGMEEKYKEVYKVYNSYQDYECLDKLIADARANNINAMLVMATNYVMVNNLIKAKGWAQKAIDKGSVEAYTTMSHILGFMKVENDFLQTGVKMENPLALYTLGQNYFYGNKVAKSYPTAEEWYIKAHEAALKKAAAGDAWSMYVLGRLYVNYYSDPIESTKWHIKAAESGNLYAMEAAGDAYLNGRGTTKDIEKGFKYYDMALERGDLNAIGSYSTFYKSKENKNDSKSFEWDMKGARAGDPFAMHLIGDSYLYGQRVQRDYDQALYWYKRSAKADLGRPMYQLGRMYKEGWGVEKSFSQAEAWLSKAANKYYADAYFELGMLYYKDEYGKKDYYQAEKWMLKAVEAKVDYAEDWLGNVYNHGLKNYPKAIEYYLKSIEKGSMYSMNSLGMIYFNGNGVKKDYDEAMNYFKRAAEKGYYTAMENIAGMYENGYGVKKNKSLAQEWREKAAAAKNK